MLASCPKLGVIWQNKGAVSTALRLTVEHLHSGQRDLLYPAEFLEAITSVDSRWNVGQQHDASEFLLWLLEAVQQETCQTESLGKIDVSTSQKTFWMGYLHDNNTPLTRMVVGQSRNTRNCKTCKKSITGYEFFRCIPVCITGDELSLDSVAMESDWKCPDCDTANTIITAEIVKPPNALFVQLLRFKDMEKNTKEIAFSHHLKIADTNYRLQATVNHHGQYMEMGHYTAQIHLQDGWKFCNDEIITHVKKPVTKSQSVYLLLYLKDNCDGK